jgi:hypothetical protein
MFCLVSQTLTAEENWLPVTDTDELRSLFSGVTLSGELSGGAKASATTWAERHKRVFDIDISVCPLCGGRLRVIADVTDPAVIQTILAHLKQRAPPGAVRRRTDLLFRYSNELLNSPVKMTILNEPHHPPYRRHKPHPPENTATNGKLKFADVESSQSADHFQRNLKR